MSDKTREHKIVNHISYLIMIEALAVASEQRDPRRDPDSMDSFIKNGVEKIAKLRAMRNEFEDLMAGLIGNCPKG